MAIRSGASHTLQLLDLPPEIRLLIYEFLPAHRKHHNFKNPHAQKDSPHGCIDTIILETAPTSILATCRQIYNEAKPIIEDKKQAIIAASLPLKFTTAAKELFRIYHVVEDIIRYSDGQQPWGTGGPRYEMLLREAATRIPIFEILVPITALEGRFRGISGLVESTYAVGQYVVEERLQLTVRLFKKDKDEFYETIAPWTRTAPAVLDIGREEWVSEWWGRELSGI